MPGEGHEKGGVEGEVGQFRRNYLVPVPKVREPRGVESAAGGGNEGRRAAGDCRAGRRRSAAAMLSERAHLLPLSEEGFDLASVHFPTVNASGCVRVLTNFYSTPLAVGTAVQVKVYASYVEVWSQGRCVARHERCYGQQQKVLELAHYLDALTKKPGAFAGSTALEQCRAQGRWPLSYDQFWEVLKQRQGGRAGRER